jgi:hypothetical protein
LGERQRLDQHGAHHREDRGVRTCAKRDDENGQGAEAWMLAERSDS